jgi:hypothetical protein
MALPEKVKPFFFRNILRRLTKKVLGIVLVIWAKINLNP